MENEWEIDSNESDVLIKSRHSLIGYMPGNKNNFKGHVAIQNNEVEDASIEFSLYVKNKQANSNGSPNSFMLTLLHDTFTFPIHQ